MSGEKSANYGQSSNHVNQANDLHGDWLVVQRKRRNPQARVPVKERHTQIVLGSAQSAAPVQPQPTPLENVANPPIATKTQDVQALSSNHLPFVDSGDTSNAMIEQMDHTPSGSTFQATGNMSATTLSKTDDAIAIVQEQYSILSPMIEFSDTNILCWNGLIRAFDKLRDGFSFCIGDGTTSFWYDSWLPVGKLCDVVPFVHISDTCLKINDIIANGYWNFDALFTILHVDARNLISNINPILKPTFPDSWKWDHDGSGKFSSKSAYSWLLLRNRPAGNNYGCWSRNPSCMGIGGVLRDHEGRWTDGFSACIADGDPLRAELLAAKEGLILAWSKGITSLICESDSLDVVQNLDNYMESVMHPHKDILSIIKKLLQKNWQVSITHVYREANLVADKLSRMGDPSSSQVSFWNSPPPSIKVLFDQDSLAANLPIC
ncbi:Ribonuclease H domain [Sesbania bispinosa]|nr:Ribonuclease H domain [Sesbania bispinosa]